MKFFGSALLQPACSICISLIAFSFTKLQYATSQSSDSRQLQPPVCCWSSLPFTARTTTQPHLSDFCPRGQLQAMNIVTYLLNGYSSANLTLISCDSDSLFTGSEVPTKVVLLLAHWSSLGLTPFLPPPLTHMVSVRVEPRFAGCKSVTLTTEPRLHPFH